MKRMLNILRTLFTVVIIIICGAAHADMTAIASADHEDVKRSAEQNLAIARLGQALNENSAKPVDD